MLARRNALEKDFGICAAHQLVANGLGQPGLLSIPARILAFHMTTEFFPLGLQRLPLLLHGQFPLPTPVLRTR